MASSVYELITASPTLTLLASVVLVTLYAIVDTVYTRRIPANAPPEVSDNLPITGSLGFWTQRWDWFRRRRDASKTGNFTFNAGGSLIIGLSGDTGRRLMFDSKELGLSEGYALLFGQSSSIKAHAADAGKQGGSGSHFSHRLAALLKTDQLRRKLPALLSDTQEAIDAVRNDASGRTNPFESIYRLVFRLTIRIVGADEMANNAELLAKTLALFEMIDSNATAAMFPRLPSLALLKRTYAGTRMYMMIGKMIKARAAASEKHDDALQYLLDQGDDTPKIVEFIFSALFAGLLNSGINAAWIMCYFATSPEWLAKATDEVCDVAAKYARDPNAPLRRQLDDVPLEAWEAEFPIIDICMRDSIRLNLLGTAMRRNISGKPVPIGHGDEVIPPDAYVAYPVADLHLDPEVYPNPYKWDPARYLPERAEDKKKAVHGYVGWGAGRHPCLGMRFAKLEQNLIAAYFIAAFDFDLRNEQDTKLAVAPQTDFNGHSAHKPAIPLYLRVTPKEK
ncbi:cytochrome P450 [Clathrospora elynae]|uniref:Cytochrome P450 n=1 Tax=Clathrospora elynae TaxID=706981 RepID=A0A6A5SWZ1_9PLEO|nr:cytochrome P450 [Clathrospora elynae]